MGNEVQLSALWGPTVLRGRLDESSRRRHRKCVGECTAFLALWVLSPFLVTDTMIHWWFGRFYMLCQQPLNTRTLAISKHKV